MMSRRLAVLLMGCALALNLACAPSRNQAMAVGPAKVSAAQLSAYLKDHGLHRPDEGALEALADRERTIIASGLGERPILLAPRLDALHRRLLVDAYLRSSNPGGLEAGEAELKMAYRAFAEKRHLRHILCATEAEAKEAEALLLSGSRFEEIAKERSSDRGSSGNGGDIGWASRAQLDPNFAQVAFSLPVGKVSTPVRSQFGYHVIEVLEVRQPSDEDFEKGRAAFAKTWNAQRLEALKEGILRDPKNRVTVVLDPRPIDADPQDLLERKGDAEAVVATVEGTETVSLAQLKAFMRGSFTGQVASHTLGPSVKKQFLDYLVKETQLAVLAARGGMASDPAFKSEYWDRAHDLISELAKADYLKAFEPAEKDLRAYYERNRDRFSANPELGVAIIASNDRDMLERLARGLTQAPAGFAEAAKEFSADRETAAKGGELGWVGMGALSKIVGVGQAESIFARPKDAIVGPLETPYGAILLKVVDRRAGEARRFEDVRVELVTAYRDTERDAILSSWLLDLRARYPLRVNRAALDALESAPL